jgi:anthranilate synthase component 1
LYTDTETPISVFKKLCEPNEFAFLLESVEMEEKIGRYSFLGLATCTTIRARGTEIEQVTDGKVTTASGNPVEYIKDYISRYKLAQLPGLPPLQSGLVGYFSYDTIRCFEDIPRAKPDPLQLPDCYLMVADQLIVFDHVKHTLTVIKNVFLEEGEDPAEQYRRAAAKVEWLVRRINEIVLVPQNIGSRAQKKELPPFQSNTTREQYMDMVVKAKEYIHAGDIFQIVPSQRLSTKISGDPFDIYRALRRVNPSPYMFYLKFGDLKVVGSSPEVLVRVENGVVTTRPLAGTRHRGADPAEDKRLEEELLADPKERAEHVMLVDLGRNDLGRICEYGSVRVTEQMAVERYSHVMHIVSNVEGTARADANALDILGACFPAGTVSGAPKVRAMEIINELETEERGIYAGAVGYIDFSGNLDTCIAIRTIVVKDDTAYIQAGAGIVADSDPAREYEETINKATALLKAVEQSGDFL